MFHVSVLVAVAFVASVTASVNVNTPACIARPARYEKPDARTPMFSPGDCNVMPGGSVPDATDH
jgi:hypothetical protein